MKLSILLIFHLFHIVSHMLDLKFIHIKCKISISHTDLWISVCYISVFICFFGCCHVSYSNACVWKKLQHIRKALINFCLRLVISKNKMKFLKSDSIYFKHLIKSHFWFSTNERTISDDWRNMEYSHKFEDVITIIIV